MAKFVAFFDPHISITAPRARKGDYYSQILSKISEIVRYANTEKADAVLCLGDMFHNKRPSANPPRMFTDLIEMFSGARMPVLSIVGNHDIYASLEEFDAQPLAVLEASGTVNLLDHGDPVVFGNTSVNGSAWRPELDTSAGMKNLSLAHDTSCPVKIDMLHQMLLPDGESFPTDFCNFSDTQQSSANVVLCGHYHPGFGIQKTAGKTFINTGSLARVSVRDNWVPSFLSIDTSDPKDIQVTKIPVSQYVPFEEVFDTRQKEKKQEDSRLDAFIANLKDLDLFAKKAAGADEIIQVLVSELQMPKKLIPLAEQYLS